MPAKRRGLIPRFAAINAVCCMCLRVGGVGEIGAERRRPVEIPGAGTMASVNEDPAFDAVGPRLWRAVFCNVLAGLGRDYDSEEFRLQRCV